MTTTIDASTAGAERPGQVSAPQAVGARSSLRYARVAGVLYLVAHVTSVAAAALYPTGAIRSAVALEFLLALGCLGTGVLLWVLLRRLAPAKAAGFAALRGLEAAVILAGALPMLAVVWLPDSVPWLEVATAMHTASFLVGQSLVISVNTILLGWLLWTTGAVIRPLAGLGFAGGVIVLASNAAQLWGFIPQGGALAGVGAVPIFAFEIWFAVTLLVKGLRV